MQAMQVVVDNRIRVPLEGLPRAARAELESAFTYENPDVKKLKSLGFRRRLSPTVCTWRYESSAGQLSFPRGGLGRVRSILIEHGVVVSFVDGRSLGDREVKIPPHRRDLWACQVQMVDAALAYQNCLWRSGQASGKTTAAIALASRVSLPTLVIVATGNLQEQWVRRASDELGVRPRDVGVIRGPHTELGRCGITVGMEQTLRKRVAQLRGRFGMVIADEAQLFGAAGFEYVIDELDAKYRLGITGDERRADRKEFLIYDQFGSVAVEITNDELVAAGAVLEVEVRVVPTDFRADWYTSLPHQKKVRKLDQLLKEMGKDADRNAMVLQVLRSATAEGQQAVALTHRREHCHIIDSLAAGAGLRPGLLIGGQDYSAEFERTRAGFERGEIMVAVGTYQAIGVGFDVPSASVGVCMTPVANGERGEMQFRQFRGRFARTCAGKEGAVLYYLWDRSVFGLRPVRNLKRWNKRVLVLDRDGWVPASTYVKQRTGSHQEDDDAT
jgi:superfamily II DNA or RNA helicase